MRRWIVTALASALLLAVAAPANADRAGKVELLSERAAAVVVGDTVWLAFTWRAHGDLTDFRVVVRRADEAVVAYPENTATYTAPYQSPHLMDGEIDYTAIRVHVPASMEQRSKDVKLQLEASWDDSGRRRSAIHNVKVPIAFYEGADVAQVTDVIEVAAGEGTWVEVAYAGLAPLIERFSVVIDSSAPVPITYPGYGSDTSLHHDAALEDGETDVVRFFVDAADVKPGEFELTLLASYARGGRPGGIQDVVTVSVLP